MNAAIVFMILAAAAAATPVQEADRLAAESRQLAASDPDAALAKARAALARTAEFHPTAFITAGRRGEVVEDEYKRARAAYRAHRGPLFAVVGEALARKGEHLPAVRYLARAQLLAPSPDRARPLAQSLLALGRGAEALAALRPVIAAASVAPDTVAVLEQTVDAAGGASVQGEIDRARIESLALPGVEVRTTRLTLPFARLSTGAPLMLDARPIVFYLAGGSCRTCSADLEALTRAGSSARIVMVPLDPENDHALRQILQLYRRPWPLALGTGVGEALGVPEGQLLVVARGGWTSVRIDAPYEAALPKVLALLARRDVMETVPRASYAPRPTPSPSPSPQAASTHGLVFGEGAPAPPEFDRAVAAYRAGGHAEALALIESLERRGDGWLLPPEARIDRSLCLAGLGRREQARAMLLRIGDGRDEAAPDRALEDIATRRR